MAQHEANGARPEEDTVVTTLAPGFLRCDYLVNPLGIDAARPHLSWTLTAHVRAARQSGYQILVAADPEALSHGRGDLWDSGRVDSPRSSHVVYEGIDPAAGQRCWWAVRAWDGEGEVSAWTDPAWWERGLAHDGWHGQWVGLDGWNGLHMPATPAPGAHPDPDAPLAGLIPSPYLRTALRLEGRVRRARLYATARGLYELRLNGARVGDRLLTPGWTDYDRRIQYQTYDVTELLLEGENALGAILAPGWYSGYAGFGGCRHYGSRPQLLLEGSIEYDDGRVLTFASDGSWRAATGPIGHSDLLMGEHYDATAALPGWDLPGYDDAGWRPVATTPRDPVPLVADLAEPIQIVEELTPLGIAEPAPAVHVFDLGQNIAGWVRLRLRGPAGTHVRLRFAEILTPAGLPYTENLRAARAVDTYVLAGGDADEVYEPRFTFHGFRYVELTGFPGTVTAATVTGLAIASNTARAGTFRCSSALVTQLQRNIEWGQRGNFLSIPTDCPQRDERLGWLGDAQVFVGTACCNADVAAFFTKWMVDVEDAQSTAGGFPDVAPRLSDLADGSPAWADAGVIVPWTVYRRYGDTGIVRRHYAAMARYMDYLLRGNPGYLRLGRLNNNFGDWLAIGADTPSDVLATAYWAYDARLMAEMAGAIGETVDATRYAEQSERIKAAFIAAYVDAEGHVAGRTQTAYLVALHMDLLPAELRAAAAAHLVADIQARDWHLSTGFVGVGYLCPVLAETGHLDVAYRLLLNETFPSWGYSIREGATTIWERWDGFTREHGFQTPAMNSFNHYSLGSVGEWLYRDVAGIDTDPAAPGYARIVIRPMPGGGLTSAEATYRSMHGPIASAWHLADGAFTLDLTLPANTSATVHIPTADPAAVREGEGPAAQSEGVRPLGQGEGCAIFAVGSGAYCFSAPYRPIG